MWPLTALLLAGAPLGFAEALSRVDDTPELLGAQAAARVRHDAVSTLGPLTSNPQLTVQPGFRTLPTQPAGPDGYLGISQSFNLGGLAGHRRAVLEEEGVTERARWRARRSELRVSVARAWLDGWVARAAVAALGEERSGVASLVERLERAAGAGAATRVELATARAFLAELRLQTLEWEGRGFEAAVQLATLLALDALPEVAEALPELDVPPEAPPDFARLPKVRLLDASGQLEGLRGEEVVAQWATQLQLSLQVGHEWQGQWFGYLGAGLTLPLFEHGQRERAVHRANQHALEGALLQARRNAGIEWQYLQHELEHTEQALEVAEHAQLPAANEAATLERLRYERGEATLLEVTLLQRQAVAARIVMLTARANRLAARHRVQEVLRAEQEDPR